MKRYGYLRGDSSGHWYLIPEEFLENYENLRSQMINSMEQDDWEGHDELASLLEEAFGEFRVKDGITNVRILINKS